MKELGSEVAGDGENPQQTQPKTEKIIKNGQESTHADENVDADHARTVRPVESEQSIGLFTQREEIDIDFRVSGLPHAVVKQAENFRVRTREEDRESSSSTSTSSRFATK